MKIPQHIGIIMDGNGRWAEKKDLPRREGHKKGVETLKTVVEEAVEMDVPCLTVYAFSTENWARPRKEVNYLFNLFRKTIKNEARELTENNIQIKIIGRRDNLPRGLIKDIKELEDISASNNGLILNIAFNYGGRAEIIDTFKQVLSNYNFKKIKDEINEELIKKNLYNPQFPEVELLIRTGGEKRLSNFLLWEAAYAELYFTDKFWPEFKGQDLKEAIAEFQSRDRRFGGIN